VPGCPGVERVTGDVDTVVDAPDDPSSAEILLRQGVAEERVSDSSVLVGGVKVDLIDTMAIPDEFLAAASEANDHFVAAHRYGLESATDLCLMVSGGPRVTMPVAVPSALVAMKLHAARWRHNRAKVSSDLFDLYRLLSDFDRDGQVASALSTQPALNRLCLDAATYLFVERLTANAGIMSTSSDGVISSVNREMLGDVGGLLVERLARSIEG
jgi:hypothetical protein